MRAGTQIKISPGFSAANGSTFHAYIENFVSCTNPWRVAGADNQVLKGEIQDNQSTFSTYPNPFINNFDVNYRLSADDFVKIELFDLKGVKLSTLLKNKYHEKGVYKFNVNAASLPAGVYNCRLVTSSGSATKKVIKLN